MRQELKVLLNEPEAVDDQWTSVSLNRYLNLGLAFVQSRILALDPEAFVFEDAFGLVAGQDLYPVPAGTITVRRVMAPNRLRLLHEAVLAKRNAAGALGTPDSWARYGRFMRLSPTPDTTAADAARISYVPTLTMAVDADVPPIHEHLHWAIVLRASLIALGSTADKDRLLSRRVELADVLDDLPLYYRPVTDGPTAVRPGYDIIDGDDPQGFIY